MNALFSRTDRSVLGRWWWTVDRGLLAALLGLVVIGVMMVMTASPPVAQRIHEGQYYFIIRHLAFLAPALAVMIGVSLLDTKWVRRVGTVVLGCSILAMIAVLFIGIEIKGAQRWIHLPFFSLQPSEFVKPSLAIVSAWLMAKQKETPTFRGGLIAAGIYAVTAALLLFQPDFGMTVVTTVIYGAQLFLAGLPMVLVIGLAVLAVGGGIGAYFGLSHVRSRVDRFLDPTSGDNYQVQKSMEAFQNGGLLGTGAGQGEVKLSLPDAHADFIFSVAGEEMGVIFAIGLVVLFGFILLRGLNRLMDNDDLFCVLATAGLLVMFGMQALVHMGSSLHLLPAKGMTLPFVSYGGSSMLAIAFAMGAVLALTRRQVKRGIAKGSIVSR